MSLFQTDSSTSKLLLAASASAAASSLLTYAVFRWHGTIGTRRSQLDVQQQQQAAAFNDATLIGELRSTAPADPYDPSPRLGYLSWDDYFMAVAFLSAQRSKDPNKQVGACIVDQNNIIRGIGYNGFPRGCPDSQLPWAKKSHRGDPLETKYLYVCHAEMNAVLNKNGASVVGARMYVTMFPCNECAKLMIQAGISEIVYHEGKEQPALRPDTPPGTSSFNRDQQYAASRRLLSLAGVKLRQHLFKQPVLLRLTNDSKRPAVLLQPDSNGSNGSDNTGGGSGVRRPGSSRRGGGGGGGDADVSPSASGRSSMTAWPDLVADAAAAAATEAPAIAAALQHGENGISEGNGTKAAAAAAAAEAAATTAGSGRRRRGRRQPAHTSPQP